MSLSESSVGLIRKLKFHTKPLSWVHQRVFEFIACKTKVDNVQLHFDSWRPWSEPWFCDVTVLPWRSRMPAQDIVMQREMVNVYCLCRLNGLRRLAITMVSRFKFHGPILSEEREKRKHLHADQIALFRSKCFQKRHFELNRLL